MNTIDLINKVAISNNLNSGRAEMIISIIMEKISDGLKKEGEVIIENFGTFKVHPKKISASVFGETGNEVKNSVTFIPDRKFLELLNT
jgi:nucleoid DNA-binding protein